MLTKTWWRASTQQTCRIQLTYPPAYFAYLIRKCMEETRDQDSKEPLLLYTNAQIRGMSINAKNTIGGRVKVNTETWHETSYLCIIKYQQTVAVSQLSTLFCHSRQLLSSNSPNEFHCRSFVGSQAYPWYLMYVKFKSITCLTLWNEPKRGMSV